MVNTQEINQLLDYLDVPMALPYDSEEASSTAPEADAQSESIISSLDTSMHSLAREMVASAAQEGIQLRITSGYRSPSSQDKIYQQGRTVEGPVVTNARPGYSKHNFGVAFDVAPIKDGKVYYPNDTALWKRIGQIGKSLGLKWGGDWSKPDLLHFEHPIFEMKDLLMGKAQTMYSRENLDFIAKNKYARMEILGLMKHF